MRAKVQGTVLLECVVRPDGTVVVPIEDIFAEAEAREVTEAVRGLMAEYRDSLPRERRALIDRYRYAHAARQVAARRQRQREAGQRQGQEGPSSHRFSRHRSSSQVGSGVSARAALR